MNAKCKFLGASFIVLAIMSATAAAQTVVPVGPFTSVKADGGHNRITLSYGAAQRVTLLSGDSANTQIATDGDRLVINNCRLKCPRGYKAEIEIVTPVLKGISLSNGGFIQSRGDFPSLAAISVAVDNGGMIDIRSLTVRTVAASVHDGGRILVKPQSSMVASVADGGAIFYWGDPHVSSVVQRGGVVRKGSAADVDTPISDLRPSVPAPVPPVKAIKRRGQFWE